MKLQDKKTPITTQKTQVENLLVFSNDLIKLIAEIIPNLPKLAQIGANSLLQEILKKNNIQQGGDDEPRKPDIES